MDESSVFDMPKPAAVAVHLFAIQGQFHFILIERSTYEGQHSGQIALPGGKPEPNDPDLLFTARRESCEEIGIDVINGTFLKRLSKVYIPVSGFEVNPFVIFHDAPPQLEQNFKEVAHILLVPTADLLNAENQQKQDIQLPNGMILKDQPCFILKEKVVWGATAKILDELRFLLSKDLLF